MNHVQRRSRSDRSTADRLRLRHVRALERVRVERLVARDARNEHLRGALAGIGAEQADLGRPVDRVLDGLTHVDVVERRTCVVHRHVVDARRRADEEAALVDAVLLREAGSRRRRNADQVHVGLAGLDLQQRLIGVHVRREHDLVGVRRAVALVVRVPLQHRRAARIARGDVVRAGRRVDVDPLARCTPCSPGPAVNHCIDRIDTNVAFGFVRWNVRVSPLAVMPEILRGLTVEERLAADDVVLQRQVDAERRAHLRAQDPLPRPLIRRGRHGRAVRELQARTDVERVGLAVARHRRERRRTDRRELAAGSTGLLLEADERHRRRVDHRPVVGPVGELRIDEVEVRLRLVDPERATLVRFLGAAFFVDDEAAPTETAATSIAAPSTSMNRESTCFLRIKSPSSSEREARGVVPRFTHRGRERTREVWTYAVRP